MPIVMTFITFLIKVASALWSCVFVIMTFEAFIISAQRRNSGQDVYVDNQGDPDIKESNKDVPKEGVEELSEELQSRFLM